MKPALIVCGLGLCTLAVAASASTLIASADDETPFVLHAAALPPLTGLSLGTRGSKDTSVSVNNDGAHIDSQKNNGRDDKEEKKKRFCTFRFEDAALEYDLCPIFEHKGKDEKHPWNRWVWWKKDTPPTVTSTAYVMSLRGALDRNESRPADEQCPEGTWVCMTTWNYAKTKSEPWRVTQVVPVAGNLPLAPNHTRAHHPGLNATVKLGRKHGDADHPDLTIVLHGGSYVGKNQSAALYFHCNASAEEPTNPEYGWEYAGYHVLHWRTKHACPRALSVAPNPNPNPKPNPKPNPNPNPNPAPNEPDPTPETPPDDIPADAGGGGGGGKGNSNSGSNSGGEEGGGKSDEDQEFLVPPGPIESRRRVSVLAVLGVLTLTAGTVYVLYTRSSRVRALISIIPTSLPFNLNLPNLRVPIPTIKSPILPSFSSLSSLSSLSLSPSKMRSARRRWRVRKSGKPKGLGFFRPPESRLRAWAVEEGGLLDEDYERGLLADIEDGSDEYDLGLGTGVGTGTGLGGEEDFMVNGRSRSNGKGRGKGRQRERGGLLFATPGEEMDEDDGEDVDMDEEMPLTPSPRVFRSGGVGGVKNYGSAG